MPDNAEALREAVKLGQKVGQPITSEPIHYAIIPNDCKTESLERFQFTEAPARKQAAVTLYDADSFVRYWLLFHNEQSRIFASPSTLTFVGIIDYHHAGDGPARFRQHHATFTAVLSDQWKAWTAQNGKKMSQVEFAAFIEDNTPDIVNAALMKDVATDLQAREEADFASATRLDNGQTEFLYQQTIKGTVGKGKSVVPETFKLNIPVFLNEPAREITARLRWRLAAGKLTFWYDLFRASEIIDGGFRALVTKIETGTSAEILMGITGIAG